MRAIEPCGFLGVSSKTMTKEKYILVSAMKNEAPFLLEWVAYHRAIGFDTIIIYSNPSDDGTEELLEALDSSGIITHRRSTPPSGVSAQNHMAVLFNSEGFLKNGDWCIWLDGDEFLNVHVKARTVQDLAAAMNGKQGLLVPWRLFGNSGLSHFPGRQISAEFTGAAKVDYFYNRHIKTFFKFDDGIVGLGPNCIHRPKLVRDRWKASDFLNGQGKILDISDIRHVRWLNGEDSGKNWGVRMKEHGYALAQINHYIVRTPEFFLLKQSRGRGAYSGKSGNNNNRHTPAFFSSKNKNDAEDSSILFWEKAVTEKIKILSSMKLISPAIRDTTTKIQQQISTIPQQEIDALMTEDKIDVPIAKPNLTFPKAAAQAVKEAYTKADVILEYGSGGSTIFAGELPDKVVYSVENAEPWFKMMSSYLEQNPPISPINLHHVDIGEVKAWGRPRNENGWRGYSRYPLSVWDIPDFQQPDVVLIDGRFRVGCFLAAMYRCEKPMTILFDDYTNREKYHVVERFFKVSKTHGRMAQFDITPTTVNPRDLEFITRYLTESE